MCEVLMLAVESPPESSEVGLGRARDVDRILECDLRGGAGQVKRESMEAKGHNSDHRTKREREGETMSYRPGPGPGPGMTTMGM